MNIAVFSTSLHPDSRSRVLAKEAVAALEALGVKAEYVDLLEKPLPRCDGDECYSDPAVEAMREVIARASGILVATPVYNYSVSAAAKNLLELTGSAWAHKAVGFLCAAGGQRSYMSVMNFANSLMLDFRCVIVPRFVYTTDSAIRGDRLVDEDVRERIEELARLLHHFAESLVEPPDSA